MAQKTLTDRIAAAIREAYPIPDDLARLRSLATFDLWHGPMAEGFRDEGDEGEPWPGFVTACERLRAWADDLPSELWYDDDCGNVSDALPETFIDEDTGEEMEACMDKVYHVDSRGIRSALFPLKLAEYL